MFMSEVMDGNIILTFILLAQKGFCVPTIHHFTVLLFLVCSSYTCTLRTFRLLMSNLINVVCGLIFDHDFTSWF